MPYAASAAAVWATASAGVAEVAGGVGSQQAEGLQRVDRSLIQAGGRGQLGPGQPQRPARGEGLGVGTSGSATGAGTEGRGIPALEPARASGRGRGRRARRG